MSDTVILALIAMLQSWGNSFWDNIAVIIPAIAAAIMLWRQNERNERKSAERADALNCKIESVEAAAVTTAEQAALMAKGAERQGVEIGIKTERLRASDFQRMKPTFTPENTDVFIVRTDGTDPNNQR